MIDERERFERAFDHFQPPDSSWDRMVRRRARKQRNKRIATVIVALAIAALGIAGPLVWFRSAGPKPATQTPIPIRNGRIVFASTGDCEATNRLFTMAPDGTDWQLVADAEAENPDWSPDGATIAFDNGSVVCAPKWSHHGDHILVVRADGTGLRQMTSGGGSQLTPDWSPDGKHITVTAFEPGHPQGIGIVDASTGQVHLITSNPFPGHMDKEPSYSPDGSQIVFVRERSLTADGDPGNSSALFVVSSDGTGLHHLTPWFQNLVGTPSWSPDGSTIVFYVGFWRPKAPKEQLYSIRADGSSLRQLTFGERWLSFRPQWSPDGRYVVFTRMLAPRGNQTLYTMRPDGSDVQIVPTATGREMNEADWGIHP